MEQRHGNAGRRGGGIQRAREGYPDCASGDSEVWWRASDTPINRKSIELICVFCRDKPLSLLTKGDNNAADDTELYARGQNFLDRSKDVVGSVMGFVPFVGYVTILLSEYPWLKTAMLVFMALTVVLQRE